MDHVYRTPIMQEKNWKLPFNVAIALHLLVFLGAIYLPEIFKTKPKFADVYTVSIVNIAEPTNSPQAPAKAPKAAAQPPTKIKKTVPPAPLKTQETTPPPVLTPPIKSEKVAPIAEAPKPVEQVQPKAISLKPLKKKIVQDDKKLEELTRKEAQERKQEIEKKLALDQKKELEKKQEIDKKQEVARKQELDRKQRQQRQKLAQALQEEELLTERSRLAQEAVDTERQLLESSQQLENTLPSTATATKSTGSGSEASTSSSAPSGSSSLLESQYLASVFNRLHQFWTPPEYLQQDPNLTAVVVITVTVDGTVANMLFESKSGNRIFDQFVSKTIEAAAPLPPIPPALKKQRFEIGLRFKPGSIQ